MIHKDQLADRIAELEKENEQLKGHKELLLKMMPVKKKTKKEALESRLKAANEYLERNGMSTF